MNISPECLKLVQRQVGIEEFSSRVYLALANWCGFNGYKDAQGYYMSRAAEELTHRDKIFTFLLDCNYEVSMGPIPAPEYPVTCLEDTITNALTHEKKVSASILEIMAMADEKEDENVEQFFLWFVGEQREEEATYIDLVDYATQLGLFDESTPDWFKGSLRAELEERIAD